MKWLVGVVIGFVAGFMGGWLWFNPPSLRPEKLPEATEEVIQPLLKFTIENLGRRDYQSEIIVDEITASESGFFVQKFYFDSDGKKVTGLAHIPGGCDKCPVIVQIRGYAEPENYQSGYGTRRSAQKFAQAGFISLAPDFLGYGGSASPSANIFEARFETYTTALNLLAAIEKWEKTESIAIWGHSNGGQIALTVLEISGKDYPTVLWAPVSAPFPYSILYYIDETGDRGKLLRRELAKFEEDYDVEQYSLFNYLDRIAAPVLLQQGTADESVPYKWNGELAKKIKAEYMEYAGADHNLIPHWSEVVQKDVEFFRGEGRKF